MDFMFLEQKQRRLLSPAEQPYFISQFQSQSQFPPQNLQSESFSLNNKVSPSILLIIIILAIIFFVSGLLHLVRFLWKSQIRDPDDFDNVTALQGQLQQLFHLHDSGVDQSFIDTLPVFNYKAIIGTKNLFDCAVCLCEFEPEDKLRLLQKCSHAFHMECIDTWLLSHSTCPLCRASLLPDFSPNNSCSPIVLVLESGSESSREMNVTAEREAVVRTNSSSHLGFVGEGESGPERIDFARKSGDFGAQDDPDNPAAKIVPVKLGKFRNVDGGETSSTGTCNVDARRCFSMGSFEYVMDENSCLQVPIRTPLKKQPSKKPSLPLTAGHRPAMSVCDSESRRGFIGFEAMRSCQTNLKGSSSVISGSEEDGKAIGRSRKESFSISKIWLRGKQEKANLAEDSPRRAFSFRFPGSRNPVAAESDDALVAKNVAGGGAKSCISEMGSCRWESGGLEQWCDVENQSCNSVDRAKTPSFARTLLWLVGGQNKVVHSSFTPDV